MKASEAGGELVQARPDIKQDPISKITNMKRTGGVAEVGEEIPFFSSSTWLVFRCSGWS
jgi:hypothetical protein